MENYGLNQFAISILLMFAFFGGEFLWGKFVGKRLYTFHDSLANILCGLFERSIFVLFAYFYYQSFSYLYQHHAWLNIPDTIANYILLFLLIDLLWYIYHRAGHEINVLWAAHVTHHQSESFNLSVSFRVSSVQLLFRMFFWSLLPIIGFQPTSILLLIGIHGAYQFFIHTALIPKLGFFEFIFVTPSHHRVHHGRNAVYLDKNYGGVLIIWDRLFGTYAEEKEAVSYGTVQAFTSIDPFKAWFQWYVDLWHASRLLPKWRQKLALWFAKPESMAFYKNQKTIPQSTETVSPAILWYTGIHTALALLHLWFLYAAYGVSLNTTSIWFLVIWLVLTSWSLGQTRPWRRHTVLWELLRLSSWAPLLYLLTQPYGETLAMATALLLPFGWLIWLITIEKRRAKDSSA
jgi:alkylglycerol monooxygenase